MEGRLEPTGHALTRTVVIKPLTAEDESPRVKKILKWVNRLC